MSEKSSGEGGFFSYFGTLDPARAGPKVEKNPSDIPKEELLQLCMKLNKRMQAMEGKAQDYAKKYKQCLVDRSLLIDLIKASLSAEVELPENDSLDIDTLKDAWLHQLNLDRGHAKNLEAELRYLKQHSKPPAVDSADPSPARPAIEEEAEELWGVKEELKSAKVDNERLTQSLKSLRTNFHSLELSLREKSSRVDQLQSTLDQERASHEEDLVFLRMQLLKAQEGAVGEGGAPPSLDSLQQSLAERELEVSRLQQQVSVLHEVKAADSSRVEGLESELQTCRERIKEAERNCGASTLLKAEQDALLASLRRDLKSALGSKEESQRRVKELEEYRVKAEGQLVRLMEHKERLVTAEAQLEESQALVTRLQTQLHTVERNYATKTALLAASEEKCEELRSEGHAQQHSLLEVVERMSVLQTQMAAAEEKIAQQIAALAQLEQSKQQELQALQAQHRLELQRETGSRDKALAEAQQEFSRKSNADRMLLGEREEELRALKSKVVELKDEIASGG
jgi:chromosome segregation ATPase